MRKMMVPLALLALLIWIIGGSWWYSQQFISVQASSPAEGESSELSHLSISHSSFETDAIEALAFNFSDPELQVSTHTHKLIRQLIDQLKEVNQVLFLRGLYLDTEEYKGSFDNLGLARAAFVKRFMVRLGAKPSDIEIGGQRVSQLLQRDNQLLNAVQFELTKSESIVEPSKPTAKWTDLMRPLNLQFRSESTDLELTPQLQTYLKTVEQLLQEHSGAMIWISGFRRSKKDQPSTVRRTESVQQLFLQQGFDAKRIVLQYEQEASNRQSQSTPGDAIRRVEVRVLNRE
ncbi:MAG: hypothetical protein AAF990_26125 [Bacteroidota bacterium]